MHLLAHARKSKRIVIKSSHQKALSVGPYELCKTLLPRWITARERLPSFYRSHEIFRLSLGLLTLLFPSFLLRWLFRRSEILQQSSSLVERRMMLV